MTAEAKRSTDYYRLNGGLNTEFNELGFPEGFTTDEANYELLVDGSRRRRKGLAEESGGSTKVMSLTATHFKQTYLWRNVGADPTLDFVVFRSGASLFFAEQGETLSSNWKTDYVDMSDFEATGATTANFENAPISFAHGRGRLLVTGQYLKPFYVEFDGTDFTATAIDVRIRDFSTINDGTLIDDEPTGTITADHKYNLFNRGWNTTDLTQFNTDLSKNPALNAVWYKGFKRTYGVSVAEMDGTRSWDSTKMDAEVFGNSSAPVGALFLSPFDTTKPYTVGGSNWINISTWTVADSGASTWDITITTASAHGLSSGDDIVIDGNTFYYATSGGGFAYGSLDGSWTCKAGTTGSTIRVDILQGLIGFSSFVSQYYTKGQVDVAPLTRSTGTAHTDSMRAVAWYAGRAFYAGMANTEFGDSVFYSQLVDTPEKYGKCYQEADPTDETFNALVPTDGGELIISGMGGVVEMVATRDTLLIFGKEGVWEVRGGNSGFTADQFSIRKLTDEACSSGTSIMRIENSVVYTGPGGIYIIAPNQYTGQLEVTNAITQTIQTKWNSLTTSAQERCQAFYDDAQKRAYFLVRTGHAASTATAYEYDEILIFDSKIAAWYRYTFSAAGLKTACTIPTADDPTTNKKMKFIYNSSGTNYKVADFDQTSFDDWDGNNGPLPYMYTGWDLSTSYQSRRQAPVIVVHSKRTETGYTESGNGWAATNPSSTTMTAYWDWTDDAITNKIGDKDGNGQEVYRHVRDFVPAAADDVNGYPVVTTRNKVRGRGRALQLKFEGATDKDSHILGFTVNHKVTRRI